MTALHQLSAADLITLIRSKKLSPEELMQACLDRAGQLQPVLNCFITLCGEQAMAQARQAEQAMMDGAPLGLLHGIPYTVKSTLNTTSGSFSATIMAAFRHAQSPFRLYRKTFSLPPSDGADRIDCTP